MADSMDDAVRELVECFYAALDRRDWATVEALVSPRVVVEAGSSEPFGWAEWRANLEEFIRGFPDGRHEIEESSSMVPTASRDAGSPAPTPASSEALRRQAPKCRSRAFTSTDSRAIRWWRTAANSTCTA